MKICFYLSNKYDAKCLHQHKQSNDLRKRPTIAEQSTWGEGKRDDKPEDSSQMRSSPPSSSPSLSSQLKSWRKFSECQAHMFSHGPAETLVLLSGGGPLKPFLIHTYRICLRLVAGLWNTAVCSNVHLHLFKFFCSNADQWMIYLSSVWIQKDKLLNCLYHCK